MPAFPPKPAAIALALALAALIAPVGARPARESSLHAKPHPRILVIGNSLTYTNDLPSALGSLAPSGTTVDMLAFGGATLDDHLRRPLTGHEIAAGHYTDVVLQERGGDAFCPLASCQRNPSTLETPLKAAKALADQARAAGARVFYLGTWQTSRETDDPLEFGERYIAKAADAGYIEIAEPRRRLVEAHPAMAWTRADGQHPGYATTALMAVRLASAMFRDRPPQVPCVRGGVHVHAPAPGGLYHFDAKGVPETCLVTAAQAAMLQFGTGE